MTHRIIDLSGYMFSGKAAASDLLREFAGFHVANHREEFDILRLGGGLIDLKNAVLDWSPVRSHAAIRRFEKVIRKVASTPGMVARLFTTGYGYEKKYPNILEALEDFLQRITELCWETPWPYDDLDDGPIETLRLKLSAKLGRRRYRTYRLAAKEGLIPAAQAFVENLIWQGVDRSLYDTAVIHNALEPFNPGRHLDLLGERAKCIVVDRDPRDIYATAITTQRGFNDNLDLYRRIAGAHDLRVFIKRYTIYRKNVCRDEPNVLRLKLEDLVQDYESTLRRLLEFLQIEPSRHVEMGKHFSPERSAVNVGLWHREELRPFADDFSAIDIECNG